MERRKVLLTPALGLVVAGLAIVFFEITGKPSSYVLFSGQSALPTLVQHAATWSAGALVALVLCKGAAYSASLSGFRGGPVFPGMFIGAALGIALSHLPGLPMIAGVGMGIGAMTVAMLGLPLVSVLLAVTPPGGGRSRPHAAHHRGGGRVVRPLRPPRVPIDGGDNARARSGARSFPALTSDLVNTPKGAADRAFVRSGGTVTSPISGSEGPMRTTGTDTGSSVRSAPAFGDGHRIATLTA